MLFIKTKFILKLRSPPTHKCEWKSRIFTLKLMGDNTRLHECRQKVEGPSKFYKIETAVLFGF